jgi:hypothetical protein
MGFVLKTMFVMVFDVSGMVILVQQLAKSQVTEK